ncbi:MAG: oligosaccharide flippase family protein [Candidatus Rokubacteria bacterium]|nr:oligosaccharide flippase family protein [Candidatus Rokubacteria bacterium]
MQPSPREILTRLGRQSVAYSLASAVGPGAGLLLLPLYTRYLSPADYGLIALLEIVSFLLAAVFSLGMTAMVPFYYVDEPDVAIRRRCLGTLVGGVTVLNLALASFVAVAARPLVDVLLPTVPFHPFIPILALTALLDPYWIIAGAALQIQERALLYSVLSIGRILLSTALRITWVVVLAAGVLGFVTANLLTAALSALAVAPLLRRELTIAFEPRHLWRALEVGGPTVPNNLLSYGFRTLDRIVMDRFSTREQIGLYYMALRIAEVLRLVTDVFINSWRPIFFKEAGDDRFAAAVAPRVIRLVSLGFIAVFVALSLFAREAVAVLMAPQYTGAAVFVPVLLGAMVLKGLYSFPYLTIWYRKRTIYVPVLTGATLVFSVAANLTLASRWGAYGIAIAFLLSYAVLLLLVLAVARRLYVLHYPWREILTAGGLAAAAVGLGSGLEPGLATGAVKALLLGGFAASVVLAGGVSRRELEALAEPVRVALGLGETAVAR